ncbi:MAG: hypothetical protein ACTSVV_02640 [Promethearchaeota archaeon]
MIKINNDKKLALNNFKMNLLIASLLNGFILVLLLLGPINQIFGILSLILLYLTFIGNLIFFLKEDKTSARFKLNFGRINIIIFTIVFITFISVYAFRNIFYLLIINGIYSVIVIRMIYLIKKRNPYYEFFMTCLSFSVSFQFIIGLLLNNLNFQLNVYQEPFFTFMIIVLLYDVLTLLPFLFELKIYSPRLSYVKANPHSQGGVFGQYIAMEEVDLSSLEMEKKLVALKKQYKKQYSWRQNLLLSVGLFILVAFMIIFFNFNAIINAFSYF